MRLKVSSRPCQYSQLSTCFVSINRDTVRLWSLDCCNFKLASTIRLTVQPSPQSTQLSWQRQQRTTSQTRAQPRHPLSQYSGTFPGTAVPSMQLGLGQGNVAAGHRRLHVSMRTGAPRSHALVLGRHARRDARVGQYLYVAFAESVLSLGECENRDGWLVAWGLCG